MPMLGVVMAPQGIVSNLPVRGNPVRQEMPFLEEMASLSSFTLVFNPAVQSVIYLEAALSGLMVLSDLIVA